MLEKEDHWAAHQTGHNSNVVHAGLYYAPGSFKARMSVAGNRSIVEFAREQGVPVEVCGKLVVATSEAELPGLRALAQRAEANGVPAKMITPAEAHEYEPEVACVAALRVESTGIIDFPAVCAALARLLDEAGADLRLSTPALAIRPGRNGGVEIATGTEVLRADALVNCAGLHSDRVARLAGLTPAATDRAVPRRVLHAAPGRAPPGARADLPGAGPDAAVPRRAPDPDARRQRARRPERRAGAAPRGLPLARHLVADLAEAARFPGIWKLARKYGRTAVDEVLRSLSRQAGSRAAWPGWCRRSARTDLVRAGAGVRAQALLPDGTLVHDFLIEIRTAPGARPQRALACERPARWRSRNTWPTRWWHNSSLNVRTARRIRRAVSRS